MSETTLDPAVVIVVRDGNMVEYLNTVTNERWRIFGQCNLCGMCYQGAVDPLIMLDESRLGQSGAVQRLDGLPWHMRPVRPGISEMPGCSLQGEYL